MNWHEVVENCVVQVSIHPLRFDKELEREFLKAVSERRRRLPIGFENTGVRSERKKAMAKAYKRQRRQRTERRLKNQSFMEPSKRPLTGKRKKSFIRSLFSKDAHRH
jgi:hypothetical protein